MCCAAWAMPIACCPRTCAPWTQPSKSAAVSALRARGLRIGSTTGYTRTMKRELRVTEGQATQVGDVRLARGGGVQGTVFDAAGKPLSAAAVSLRPADHDLPSSYSTKSASDM